MSLVPSGGPLRLSLRPHADEAIEAAALCVESGGVLLYPTRTVYGIGGDARSDRVVERIRSIKERERDKPMLVLTDEWERVLHWTTALTDVHRALMAHPLGARYTILFEASEAAPHGVRAGSALIGMRRTTFPFCRRLIAAARTAIVSTSANVSGHESPVSFDELEPRVLAAVDLAVDAGEPLEGTASTVVAVEGSCIRVVREGAVSPRQLASIAPLAS